MAKTCGPCSPTPPPDFASRPVFSPPCLIRAPSRPQVVRDSQMHSTTPTCLTPCLRGAAWMRSPGKALGKPRDLSRRVGAQERFSVPTQGRWRLY
eukprot:351965-Chlamydomonas_euryale.AAC.21